VPLRAYLSGKILILETGAGDIAVVINIQI
jgi:hypothetical protein